MSRFNEEKYGYIGGGRNITIAWSIAHHGI